MKAIEQPNSTHKSITLNPRVDFSSVRIAHPPIKVSRWYQRFLP